MTGVSEIWSTTSEEEREEAVAAAAQAVRRGRLVVLPTDTVYGIGADAFSPEAVQPSPAVRALARIAAGRGRTAHAHGPAIAAAALVVTAAGILT